MLFRRFLQFLDPRGQSEVQAWRDGLPTSPQAKFDRLMLSLERERRPRRQDFAKLQGPCRPLWEIRFDFMNTEYRILCDERSPRTEIPEFVMLMVAEERDYRLVPSTACTTAKARMRVAEAQPGRLRAHH